MAQSQISIDEIEQKFEELFNELLDHQQNKVLDTARSLRPHLTGDDVLNPHDFTELRNHPLFNYEEGLAAGLMSAQFAIRARIFRALRNSNSPTQS